jgi:hypothetical protein
MSCAQLIIELDFSAHSNYVELCLIDMGERDVFPFVGRQTQIRLQGVSNPVFPVITGTFGGVDFLHSVMGEFDDKATQSEIQQLEDSMSTTSRGDNTSMLKNLLGQIPGGLFGGGDPAAKADELQANSNAARMQNMHVTPKRPEAVTQQMMDIQKQIYPVLAWHDDIMRSISEMIEQIPVLPELIEQVEDQINIFVFSLLAPFMLPVINQLKTELNQGSSEIIQSSQDKQLNVFHDDRCTDPTHSMLSKDHFSDVLNEPAGKVASAVISWVVPQLMQAWDDPRIDPERTINRIINGVFHHPAQRSMGDDGAADGRRLMFSAVEQWWRRADQNELRRQLSREGVQSGMNHKPGQHDTGHGCGKPLGMAKHSSGDGASGGILGDLLSAFSGGAAATGTGQGYGRPTQGSSNNAIGQGVGELLGGGALGGVVGALAGGLGGSLLSDVLGGQGQTQSYTQQYQTPSGDVTQSYTEYGQSQSQYGQPQYGQAQVQQTQYPGGGQRTEYKKYEQSGQAAQTGYGYEERVETQPTYGGGFETTKEKIYKKPGGSYEKEEYHGGRTAEGESYGETKHYKKKDDDSDDDDDEKRRKKEKKKEKKHKKEKKYGEEDSEDSEEEGGRGKQYGGGSGEDGRQQPSYGRQEQSYGREEHHGRKEHHGREETSYGRQEQSFGREEPSYGRQEQTYGREEPSYGRQEPTYGRAEPSYGQQETYGRQESSGYGGGYQQPIRQEYGSGRNEYEEPARQEYGGGGRGDYEEPSMPGGFEESNEEYGRGSRRRDDEDEGGW